MSRVEARMPLTGKRVPLSVTYFMERPAFHFGLSSLMRQLVGQEPVPLWTANEKYRMRTYFMVELVEQFS